MSRWFSKYNSVIYVLIVSSAFPPPQAQAIIINKLYKVIDFPNSASPVTHYKA